MVVVVRWGFEFSGGTSFISKNMSCALPKPSSNSERNCRKFWCALSGK